MTAASPGYWERIRSMRGLAIGDVAARACISPATVRRACQGDRITTATAHAMSRALRCPMPVDMVLAVGDAAPVVVLGSDALAVGFEPHEYDGSLPQDTHCSRCGVPAGPECDLCGGTGVHYCAACEQGHTCGRCGGQGAIRADDAALVEAGWRDARRIEVYETRIDEYEVLLCNGCARSVE